MDNDIAIIMTRRFQGKVALVTGSSNGIGRATAFLFASEGAKVTITGRNPEALQGCFNELLSTGATEADILSLQGELTDEIFQQKLVEETVKKFGKLDILINNAGGGSPDGTKANGFDQSIDVYDYVMNLNTKTVLQLTQLALPHLIKSKGEIIMISSIAGLSRAGTSLPYYCMSKAALDQLMRSLAIKYISDGVRVNGVNPGLITTTIMEKSGLTRPQVEEVEKLMSKKHLIPMEAPGKAVDVANAIAFLCDRKVSNFIVGHSLVIDGGSSILMPIMNPLFDSMK